MQDQFDWGEAVPMDVFVMADGEPENRWVTKIGGLPYRPAGLEWPTTSDGSPSFFLAQFDFTDSCDIVGDLPGDLLLVFADDPDGAVKPCHFEWHALEEENLITAAEIPKHRFSFAPCYGHIHRTENFPHAKELRSPGQEYPKCRGLDVWAAYHVPQYQATQIGEAPFYIQPRDENQPGRIICTISSVHPDGYKTYPFLNRHDALLPDERHGKYLMMGDVGSIFVSIDDDGSLHCSDACY
jgi:hypothetical protein